MRPARRVTAAGDPDQVGFATKPALARQMIVAAIEADILSPDLSAGYRLSFI